MPHRTSITDDPNEAAFRGVQALIEQSEGKNPAAVALGRLGGLKGGKARAEKLSAKKRSAIAKKGAGASDPERTYSPAPCLGINVKTISGHPDPKHVSTSYVERQNLTMRMSMKRFARLSNGFSKKIENHAHAVALHYMHYNFARIHKTLRTTPAQAAGVTDRLWEIADIVTLLDSKSVAA